LQTSPSLDSPNVLPFIFKGTTRTATPEELAIAAAASLPCPDDSDSDNDCLCLFEVLHIVNYLYIIGSLMANAYLFATNDRDS